MKLFGKGYEKKKSDTVIIVVVVIIVVLILLDWKIDYEPTDDMKGI